MAGDSGLLAPYAVYEMRGGVLWHAAFVTVQLCDDKFHGAGGDYVVADWAYLEKMDTNSGGFDV